ncbi:MAG: ABC transporter substrate-binding protein [Deltaproteobacteria bacterium]|nr:MAG: ABC transporter substrate-binding protein [Deltaproteobacteria bacterium]
MKKPTLDLRQNILFGLFVIFVFASSSWAAAARTKIIVVVPHRILFTVALPVYIAQDKGFYRENNIDVDAVFTRGGGENVQAVVSGDAQIGLGTGTLAVISAFVKKAPIKIAAAEITGMDAFWYVQSNTAMRKMEDLAGKRVAYSRPGASSHMAVLAIADQIKAKGLKPAEPVSLGGIPEVYTAVRTGQTDAGWSVAPFQLDKVEKGELRVVVRGEEINAMKEISARVHFTNNDFAAKNPDAVRGFFRAQQRALDYMFDHKEETAKIWIRRAELKFPESAVLKTWDYYNRASMTLKPIRGLQATIEDGIRNKFLTQPLTQAELNSLIDLSFLP